MHKTPTAQYQLRIRYWLLLGSILFPLAILMVAASQASAAAAKVTAKASSPSIIYGTATVISGSVSNGVASQKVSLRARFAGRSVWSGVGSGRLTARKTFTLTTRLPLGVTQLQVVAAAKGRTGAGGSKVLRVTGLLRIQPQGTAIVGESLTVTGMLPSRGKRSVILQRKVGSRWATVARSRSARSGLVSFALKAEMSQTYRVLAPAVMSKGRKPRVVVPAFASPATSVATVSQGATIDVPNPMCAGSPYEAGVVATPVRAGRQVQLQISTDGSTWSTLATGSQNADGRATLAFSSPAEARTYQFRLLVASDGGAPQVTSAISTVPVSPCGGRTLTYPHVVAGGHLTCMIDVARDTYCWGYNGEGELGDGTTTERLVPRKVIGGFKFKDIAVGYAHACGLTDAGKAYCWGNNDVAGLGSDSPHSGAIGDNTTINRTQPTEVWGNHTWKMLSAGEDVTCGITINNVAYCWGFNGNGELGNGKPVDLTNAHNELVPTPVGGGFTFKDISTDEKGVCALTIAGKAYCWGDAAPTGSPQNSPQPVPGDFVFTQIEVGNKARCGLRADSMLFCWGSDYHGVMGAGPGDSSSQTPVAVVGSSYTQFGVGLAACGLKSDGAAQCWGMGQWGAVGDNATDFTANIWDRGAPVNVYGGFTFVDLSIGYGHNCGVTAGGSVYCWGDNIQGQIGIGTKGFINSQKAPAPVSPAA